jgi:transcriptional regulator with XRE-family HTH domain
MANSKLGSTRKPRYAEMGKVLRRFRDRARLTQAEFAQKLRFSENSTQRYAEYEHGVRKLPLARLLMLYQRYVARTHNPEAKADWEQLRDLTLPPAPIDLREREFLELEEGQDVAELSSLASALYKWPKVRRRGQQRSERLLLGAEREIFRFNSEDRIPIVGGSEPDRRHIRQIPHGDLMAAGELKNYLREVGIETDIIECLDVDKAPKQANGTLIIVGGPGSNRLGKDINNALANRKMGVGGFFFSVTEDTPTSEEITIDSRWRIKAHGMPNELEIPDNPYPYAQLRDGRKEDYGILYIGANPMDIRHWLVWAAGLGSVGTVGAALVLKEPEIIELLVEGLTDRHKFCCMLVRYRFTDERRPRDGIHASVAIMRGTIRRQ